MKVKDVWIATAAAAAGGAAAQYTSAPFQPFPDCVGGLLASNKVCDRSLSPSERAAALVAALNVTEKMANLVSNANGSARIGLPKYNWWSEALHGVAYAPGTQFRRGPGDFNSSTSFPMPLLLAASFDDSLIEKIGDVIGTESRAFGNGRWSGLDYWTPNVNPFKDPRWGRGSETPGEDILRIKRYAASMIKGLEGPHPEKERRVVSTCKHYAANDFEDWNGTSRHDFDARISAQDLAEYYLMPFQQCARDSRVGSIMCAYNAVNGVPSCANSYLLDTVLRKHWGWTGHNNYVTSDCEAVLDVSAGHKYARTNAEGTAMCFEAGTDTSCEYTPSSDIRGAYAQGLLREETMDRALLRLYEGLVRVGYFDGNSSAFSDISWADVNAPAAQDLSLQSAVEGIVMLKNDGTLPLPLGAKCSSKSKKRSSSGGPKLAMIGFWADAPEKLRGGYSGTAAYLRTPAYAARQMGLDVVTAGGPVLQGAAAAAADNWTAPALAAAEGADYIVYFGGLDETAAGENKDRWDVEWPGAQLALVKRLAALGKPLVVVQMGDQLDGTPLLANAGVGAVLWASWPGQDGGPAVMRLLSGAASPAGRLPVTQYPANYTRLVPMTEMALRPSTSGSRPGRTYRWYSTPVLPFGFGLHYTNFTPAVTVPPALAAASGVTTSSLLEACRDPHPERCALPPLRVAVANTGRRASDYVALAFVSGDYGPRPRPIKTLAAYARLRGVRAGGSAEADLAWTLGDIARHDEDGNTVLYPGTYKVQIDEPVLATAEFTIAGEPVVLDKWPALPTPPS
ncbi:hypothetical protein RB597_009295 [Gaeumannomyces tritici]